MKKIVKESKAKRRTPVKTSAPANASFRDHVALQAMIVLMQTGGTFTDPDTTACDAYAFADSMLAARDREASHAD